MTVDARAGLWQGERGLGLITPVLTRPGPGLIEQDGLDLYGRARFDDAYTTRGGPQ
jgi:hypothetical protein